MSAAALKRVALYIVRPLHWDAEDRMDIYLVIDGEYAYELTEDEEKTRFGLWQRFRFVDEDPDYPSDFDGRENWKKIITPMRSSFALALCQRAHDELSELLNLSNQDSPPHDEPDTRRAFKKCIKALKQILGTKTSSVRSVRQTSPTPPPPTSKGCSRLKKSDCMAAKSQCVWVVGKGCMKPAATAATASPSKKKKN